MALGDLAGRARVRYPDYSAQGCCDRCGFLFQLDALQFQFEWSGPSLYNTGFLVCKDCLDVPFEQNRVLILPPDPIPRVNPRADPSYTPPAPAVSPQNQGFTQYILGGATPGLYPTAKADVLSQVAVLSGIPTPGSIVDRSTVIMPANTPLMLMDANPGRNWLLLYNPTAAQAQFSLTTAVWGAITNLIIGPGEAFFWATAQNFGNTYMGAISLVGLNAPLPFWAWEAA